MSTLDSRAKLAKICNVTVKESTLPELKGCLLYGSGFQLIWDPYKNKDQAMDVLLHSGISLQVNSNEVVANGEVFLFEDYDRAHYCLCDAICTSALK